MRTLNLFGAATFVLCFAASGHAATLTVSTVKDEANCRNETGCTTPPNSGTDAYPNSTGCSLREALQDVADAGNSVSISYPECGTPTTGGPNTIDLGGKTIDIYSAVNDPTDITGAAMINNTQMAFIGNKATYGSLTITNGTLTCENDPNSSPTIGGHSIFEESSGGDLSLTGVHFQSCTGGQSGMAIDNSNGGGGDLTLTGVTFGGIPPIVAPPIRATNEGTGGCINHGTGNLTITGASFTGCVVDNGGALPGSGHGNGGAIYIGGVGDHQKVAISGVAFTANIAGDNGGAIYMSGTDSAVIDTSNFSLNTAFGDTSASPGNAILGGGAIYASMTATRGNDNSSGLNLSAVLLFQDSFVGNLAPKGSGGAMVVANGNLTYGTLTVNLGDYLSGLKTGIPGGIVASNFSGNIAGGTWDTASNGLLDPRAGSGGAILVTSSNVAIYSSSFIASNKSSSASGGAIAYDDGPDNQDPMIISNTTFNNNSASVNGGAIANIISKFGGGSGKINLFNDTLSGNTTSTAAGGGNFFNGNTTASEVNVTNTIFDNGGSGNNCAGNTFTDVAGNLQHNPNAGCSGILNTGDPALGTALPFGGINALVAVMKLGDNSAASGAGDQTKCTPGPINNRDAALNTRPQGKPSCDVGAFESDIAPAWTITKSHTDPFHHSDVADIYTIHVSNTGHDTTSGKVTVSDSLPLGLTATAIAGAGWDCSATTLPVVGPSAAGALSCSRTDVLASGSAYADLILTVSVAANAPSPTIINSVTVSGGGAPDATANDQTTTPVQLQSFGVE